MAGPRELDAQKIVVRDALGDLAVTRGLGASAQGSTISSLGGTQGPERALGAKLAPAQGSTGNTTSGGDHLADPLRGASSSRAGGGCGDSPESGMLRSTSGGGMGTVDPGVDGLQGSTMRPG